MNSRLSPALAAGVLLCAGVAPSSEQQPDSLVIRSGGLIADFNSNVRLDLTNGQQGISQPITIRDQTFQIGATVQTFIDTAYIDFNYGFAVVKNQKVDIVPTIGISSVKVHVGAGLAAQTTLGGGVSRSLSADASDRSIFPVPGVQFAIRPHPHIDITGYTRFIKATLQGVTNSSWDGRIGLEFPVAKHVGGGAAYYFNHITQSGTHDTFSGNLHYTFRGPQLYGLVHF